MNRDALLGSSAGLYGGGEHRGRGDGSRLYVGSAAEIWTEDFGSVEAFDGEAEVWLLVKGFKKRGVDGVRFKIDFGLGGQEDLYAGG